MSRFLIVDEPSPLEDLELLAQWLFDMDMRIAETDDPEHKRRYEQSRERVLNAYRMRVEREGRGSGRIHDSDPAQFGKP